MKGSPTNNSPRAAVKVLDEQTGVYEPPTRLGFTELRECFS